MAQGLRTAGLHLGGEITQGLNQSDLFKVISPDHRGHKAAQHVPHYQHKAAGALLVVPKLRALEVPVRAVILPLLNHEVAFEIHEAAAGQLRGLLGEGSVWWQDPSIFHATVYHASTHRVSSMG